MALTIGKYKRGVTNNFCSGYIVLDIMFNRETKEYSWYNIDFTHTVPNIAVEENSKVISTVDYDNAVIVIDYYSIEEDENEEYHCTSPERRVFINCNKEDCCINDLSIFDWFIKEFNKGTFFAPLGKLVI